MKNISINTNMNFARITRVDEPTGEIRLLIKANGEKVLQQEFRCYDDGLWHHFEWKDIPVVKEGEE